MKNKKDGSGEKWPITTKVAVVIALLLACSTGVSWYFGQKTLQHSSLSVRPDVTISFDYDETGAGFHMSNKGLGPAVIGSFQLFVDQKIQRTWEEAGKALGLSGKVQWYKRVPYPSAMWSNPEKDERLYWVSEGPDSELLKANKDRVHMVVCYCSVSNECWSRTRIAVPPKDESSCPQEKGQLISD
jgi:hypothetical protein